MALGPLCRHFGRSMVPDHVENQYYVQMSSEPGGSCQLCPCFHCSRNESPSPSREPFAPLAGGGWLGPTLSSTTASDGWSLEPPAGVFLYASSHHLHVEQGARVHGQPPRNAQSASNARSGDAQRCHTSVLQCTEHPALVLPCALSRGGSGSRK